MFSRNEPSKIESIVGAGTELEGNINTTDGIRIDGKVKGQIRAETVIIGQKGMVIGDIQANMVTIGGKIKGNVSAATLLDLLPTGQVYGDIKSSKLVIADGACFEGNCQMVKTDGQVIELNASDTSLEYETHNGKKTVKVIGETSRR